VPVRHAVDVKVIVPPPERPLTAVPAPGESSEKDHQNADPPEGGRRHGEEQAGGSENDDERTGKLAREEASTQRQRRLRCRRVESRQVGQEGGELAASSRRHGTLEPLVELRCIEPPLSEVP
jgi:hypothetical protein